MPLPKEKPGDIEIKRTERKKTNGEKREGTNIRTALSMESDSDKMIRAILAAIGLAFLPTVVFPIFEKLNFFYPYSAGAVVAAVWVWVAFFGISISGIYGLAENEIKKLEFKEYSSEEEEEEAEDPKELKTPDQMAILWKFAMKVVYNFWISRILIAYIAAMFVAVGVFMGLEIMLVSLLIFVSFVALVSYSYGIRYFNEHAKEIKADPPNIGVLTFFGNPKRIHLASGLAFTRPPIIDFIPIDVSQTTVDFKGKLTGFFSADGVPVSLSSVKMVYMVNKKRVLDFIGAKKQAGIADITEDLVPSKLRPLIRDRPVDNLIGKAKDDSAQSRDKQYLENAVIAELIGVEEDEISPEMKRIMSKNGKSDAHRFGIKVNKFSIGMVDTSEDFAEDLRKKAREEKQRQAETFEVGTEILQAKKLFDAFKDSNEPLSFEECLKIVKDDKLVREGHGITPGLRSLLSRKGGTGGLEWLAGLASIIRGTSNVSQPVKENGGRKGKGKGKGKKDSEEPAEGSENE